jgi:hypothetical protein
MSIFVALPDDPAADRLAEQQELLRKQRRGGGVEGAVPHHLRHLYF